MMLLHFTLGLATLLCALVAGLLLTFAVVVMPGIKSLNDHDFLHSFSVMDRVIQNNQPIFMFVWVGSVVAMVISALLGLWQMEGLHRLLILLAAGLYLVGVLLPTATINIPLNNRVQALDPGAMTEPALAEARARFETKWNRWNSIRTICATLTTALLIVLIFRLG